MIGSNRGFLLFRKRTRGEDSKANMLDLLTSPSLSPSTWARTLATRSQGILISSDLLRGPCPVSLPESPVSCQHPSFITEHSRTGKNLKFYSESTAYSSMDIGRRLETLESEIKDLITHGTANIMIIFAMVPIAFQLLCGECR